jgi:23S rRNA (guanosine2251-2'-O)-methyltransferase
VSRGEPRRRDERGGRERSGARRSGDQRSGSELGAEQVEGFHAVRELLRARRRTVREVWVVERGSGAEEITALAGAAGTRVRVVASVQLEERARSEAPQGVLAIAAPLLPVAVDDLLAAPDAFLVAIDGVTDPGNLGAVLRTAETAGVTGFVLTRHRAARLGPTALKAAAGAAEYVPIALVAGVPGFLDQARRAGVWTVGLDGAGTADVGDLAVADGPVAVVIGAEGRGLGRLTRERCDVLAAIPMHGRLASLNVSAAAAIALHAVARRRHAGGAGTRL